MTDKALPIRTFVRVGFLLAFMESHIMCNKCVVPATPLLAYWAEHKTRPFLVREYLMAQYQQENMQYWSHSRPFWVNDVKPASQKVGHDTAKRLATINKMATRDVTTVEDAETISEYLRYIGYIAIPVATKIEPNYMATMNKLRDEWEGIDVIHTLHPFITAQGSTHEEYSKSNYRFNIIDRLHKVHVSTEDINQIAYYPTLKHMREGREVRTRLGRYLTKYQELLALTDSDIKNIAEKHMANMRSRGGWEVDFIEHNDAQGWCDVYASNDVGSCMRGMDAVRVYAHDKSVLRLAYIRAGEKIIARCIVRDDEYKGWIRVYPDSNGSAEGRFLLDYLKTNGYPNQTNLDGVLLRHIEESEGIVCPYIDYGNNGEQSVGVVVVDNTYYLKVGEGELEATNTSGYVNENSHVCERCGDGFSHDDSLTYIEHDSISVCECCRDNNYAYAYGRRHEDYFPEDECVRVGDNYYWVDTISYHDIGYCDYHEEYFPNDELVSTANGTFHYDVCVSVDRHTDYEYVFNTDVHKLSDGTTCHEDDAEHYQAEINDLAEAEAEA
jgi:hypothetical protein